MRIQLSDFSVHPFYDIMQNNIQLCLHKANFVYLILYLWRNCTFFLNTKIFVSKLLKHIDYIKVLLNNLHQSVHFIS